MREFVLHRRSRPRKCLRVQGWFVSRVAAFTPALALPRQLLSTSTLLQCRLRAVLQQLLQCMPCPAPAVSYAAPAPAAEYISPAPTVRYAVPASSSWVEYISPAPAVSFVAPAPVVEYISPAPAVYAAPAPVVEHFSPALAVSYAAPVPLQYAVPVLHAAPTKTVTGVGLNRDGISDLLQPRVGYATPMQYGAPVQYGRSVTYAVCYQTESAEGNVSRKLVSGLPHWSLQILMDETIAPTVCYRQVSTCGGLSTHLVLQVLPQWSQFLLVSAVVLKVRDDARKGVVYLVVLVNGVDVWRVFSYRGSRTVSRVLHEKSPRIRFPLLLCQ